MLDWIKFERLKITQADDFQMKINLVRLNDFDLSETNDMFSNCQTKPKQLSK